MTRWKLAIEYDGGPFSGWQRQANAPSVQEAVEDAVFALSGERSAVVCAGRTDAGVHARGQVAHVDIEKPLTPKAVRDALTAHLRPRPVAILSAEAVPDDFHARFSAVRRRYLYRIVNRRADLALDRGRAWAVTAPLDVDAMREGARHLVGKHDWTTFRSVQCQAASPVRTVESVEIDRQGEDVVIRVAARSFLHNQVRAFAGTLREVGAGRWEPDRVRRAREARARAECAQVAPPEGLYLMGVDY